MFEDINNSGHFSVGCEGKCHKKDLRKSHRLPLVILNITLCSLDFNISAVRTTASDKG